MTLLMLESWNWPSVAVYTALALIVVASIAIARYFEHREEMARLMLTTTTTSEWEEFEADPPPSNLISLQTYEYEHLNRIDTAAREYVFARRQQETSIGADY